MIHPKRGKVYNPEWADILEAAIPLLWNGEGSRRFDTLHTICSTLDNVEGAVGELTREITYRLHMAGQCAYFSTFYRVQVGQAVSNTEIQAARKAWMLDMIEEFRDGQNKQ